MGSQQTKEETIIAQNAAGNGRNDATSEQGYSSVSTTNILLTIIVIVVLAGVAFALCYFYKRMHKNWMERQMNRRSLRKREAAFYINKRQVPGDIPM